MDTTALWSAPMLTNHPFSAADTLAGAAVPPAGLSATAAADPATRHTLLPQAPRTEVADSTANGSMFKLAIGPPHSSDDVSDQLLLQEAPALTSQQQQGGRLQPDRLRLSDTTGLDLPISALNALAPDSFNTLSAALAAASGVLPSPRPQPPPLVLGALPLQLPLPPAPGAAAPAPPPTSAAGAVVPAPPPTSAADAVVSAPTMHAQGQAQQPLSLQGSLPPSSVSDASGDHDGAWPAGITGGAPGDRPRTLSNASGTSGSGSGGGGGGREDPVLARELGITGESLMRLFQAESGEDGSQPVWMVVNLQGKIKGSYTADKMAEFCRRGTLSARQLVLGIDRNLPYVMRQDLAYYRPLGRLAVAVHAGASYCALTSSYVTQKSDTTLAAFTWTPLKYTNQCISAKPGGGAGDAGHHPGREAAQVGSQLANLVVADRGGGSSGGGDGGRGSRSPCPGGGATASELSSCAADAALHAALQTLFDGPPCFADGRQPLWLYINHLGWCRGPFSGAKLKQAHLCGRLPRDTLVVGYDPAVPAFMLSSDVGTWFRPLGPVLDNVAAGWDYNPVTWNQVVQRSMQQPCDWQPLVYSGAGLPPPLLSVAQLLPQATNGVRGCTQQAAPRGIGLGGGGAAAGGDTHQVSPALAQILAQMPAGQGPPFMHVAGGASNADQFMLQPQQQQQQHLGPQQPLLQPQFFFQQAMPPQQAPGSFLPQDMMHGLLASPPGLLASAQQPTVSQHMLLQQQPMHMQLQRQMQQQQVQAQLQQQMQAPMMGYANGTYPYALMP